jgi:hypothetical protein
MTRAIRARLLSGNAAHLPGVAIIVHARWVR